MAGFPGSVPMGFQSDAPSVSSTMFSLGAGPADEEAARREMQRAKDLMADPASGVAKRGTRSSYRNAADVYMETQIL
jgi:hypothetical protein